MTTPLFCVYARAMNVSPKRIHFNSILRVLKSSLSMSSVPIATFEEVKDLPNHPEKLLIDVREPAEIAETGVIPTAINIPCKSLLNFWELAMTVDKSRRKWVKCDARSPTSCPTASLRSFSRSKSPNSTITWFSRAEPATGRTRPSSKYCRWVTRSKQTR